jgi:hypothetical protein|tara:strand:- start:2 stop:637 length:636 start_codon:yes stop_codon:yes gene_type:complete
MALVKYNNNSISAVTAAASIPSGGLVLIKTQTISSNTSTVSFIHGTNDVVFDGTYSTYIFKLINIHGDGSGGSNESPISFNFTTDGTNFNVTKTSTSFRAQHTEGGSSDLAYTAGDDLAQSTAFQVLCQNQKHADADSAGCIILHIFNPSSTTFTKHFISDAEVVGNGVQAARNFIAGYGNTTSAITGVQFKTLVGNVQSGIFKLYGLKES